MKPSPGEAPWRREIDELYEAFANVRKPRLRSSNPRSYDAEWIGRQPLRTLDPKLINDFAFELGFSVGDEEDIRYFVPRLFELMAQEQLNSLYSPELLAQKLMMAHWKTWSAREHAALRTFLIAWFAGSISRGDRTVILSVVTDFGMVFDDLSPLLERVRARDDMAGLFALLWLAERVGEHPLADKRQRKQKRRGVAHEQLDRWLRDPAGFAQVEAVKQRVGLVGPDGEELTSLYDQVTYALYACGALPADDA